MKIAPLFVLFCCAFSHSLFARTHHAHQGIRIQSIIDKATAGDTIRIRRGFYKQNNIVINKKLVLIGEDFPVFDGEQKNEIFIVTAHGAAISGLQIQRTGNSSLTDMAGIKLRNVNYVQIKNCKLFSVAYGIYLENCRHCEVSGNVIMASSKTEQASGNGIHAWKCSRLLISHNKLSGCRDGIYFEFVTESLIKNNLSSKNIRYGLHFMFSHNDTYEFNAFKDNGAGVAVMYTKGVTMYGNIFYHNWGDASFGILLKEISDSRIEHNKFVKNTVGIYMDGGDRISVCGNEFSENGWAMRIQASGDGNSAEKNNFCGNSFDVTARSAVKLNTFANNYWDKYDGYDLDKDGAGDVPYFPVSIYSVITEQIPIAMILYRSFLANIMDQMEKVLPSVTPDQLKDEMPRMIKWQL